MYRQGRQSEVDRGGDTILFQIFQEGRCVFYAVAYAGFRRLGEGGLVIPRLKVGANLQ